MGELADLGRQVDSGLSNMWQYYYGGWNYPAVSFETWFGDFDAAPKESDFGHLRTQIATAMRALSGDGEHGDGFGLIKDIGNVDFMEWEGKARDSFDKNVVTPIDYVPEALHKAVKALDLALDAEAEVWDKARADVKTLGQKVLNAIDAADDKSSGGASFALTVLGAVGSVALSIATAGAADVVLIAVGSVALGATSIAGSAVSVDWGDTTDPAKLINDTLTGLGQICWESGQRENLIATHLNKIATTIDADLNHGPWGEDSYPTFLLKHPYLAEHVGGLGSWTGA